MSNIDKNLQVRVRKYVLHLLSASETIEFEDFLMSNPDPELIEFLEEEQRLHSAMSQFEPQELIEISEKTALFGGTIAKVVKNFQEFFIAPIPVYASLVFSGAIAGLVAFGVGDAYSDRQPDIIAFGSGVVRSTGIETKSIFDEIDIDLAENSQLAILQVKIYQPKTKFYKLYVTQSLENSELWASEPAELKHGRRMSFRIPDFIEGAIKVRLVSVDEDKVESPVRFCNWDSQCRLVSDRPTAKVE